MQWWPTSPICHRLGQPLTSHYFRFCKKVVKVWFNFNNILVIEATRKETVIIWEQSVMGHKKLNKRCNDTHMEMWEYQVCQDMLTGFKFNSRGHPWAQEGQGSRTKLIWEALSNSVHHHSWCICYSQSAGITIGRYRQTQKIQMKFWGNNSKRVAELTKAKRGHALVHIHVHNTVIAD